MAPLCNYFPVDLIFVQARNDSPFELLIKNQKADD